MPSQNPNEHPSMQSFNAKNHSSRAGGRRCERSDGPSTSSDTNKPNLTMNHEHGLQDLLDFVENDWLHNCGLDGPAFLWDRAICELSTQADETRADTPVAPPQQAQTMMMTPIEWYFDALGSMTPTATRTANGYDIPRADMPTFHLDSHALAGVDAVVSNAMISSRWRQAAANLTTAVSITSMFIGNVADRDNEGFEFLKNLIQNVRMYFDGIARYADPETGEYALRILTKVACGEDFRLNPMQMVELLSCGLSFARWDDTRVLAYGSISQAVDIMNGIEQSTGDEQSDDPTTSLFEDASGSLVNYPIAELYQRFEQSMLLLRHDLLRISGESDAADRFLANHHDSEPMADAYAVRLISQGRWSELLDFVDVVLDNNPNQQLTMVPGALVPYEWDSIRELALDRLGRIEELCATYRERIVEAYSREESYNVARLRAVSSDDWPRQMRLIIKEYADGNGRFTRNMAYEQMLINEKLGAEAWRYCRQFPKSRVKLAKTIARAKPEQARRIILGPLHTDGSYAGRLPAHLAAYHQIARSLNKYAAVFGAAEAHDIAANLVARYPARRTLAAALHDFLH